MKLEWTETSPGNEDSPYDHIIGTYGPFRFLIEWKSWKTYPGYTVTVELTEILIESGDGIDSCKAAVEKWLDDLKEYNK